MIYPANWDFRRKSSKGLLLSFEMYEIYRWRQGCRQLTFIQLQQKKWRTLLSSIENIEVRNPNILINCPEKPDAFSRVSGYHHLSEFFRGQDAEKYQRRDKAIFFTLLFCKWHNTREKNIIISFYRFKYFCQIFFFSANLPSLRKD